MAKKLGRILIASMALLQAEASWAFNCSSVANTFPIYCRGKIYFEMNTIFPPPQNGLAQNPAQTNITIGFTKSPKAAGAGGLNLTSGTCGWVDRPLNSSEPSTINTWADIATAAAFTAGAIQSCLGDPNCIIGGCAENQGTFLQMYPWNIAVTHL